MKNIMFLFLKKLKKEKRYFITVICFIVLCALSLGSVFAYLSSRSIKLDNTFEPGIVSCKINETFDGTTKSNVFITNTGNVPAYIRASIIVNWVNEEGIIYGASTPVEGKDYQIKYGKEWSAGEDGYFYYENIVNPDNDTPILIEECKEVKENSPNGHSLYIEIVSSAVQADPNKTEETWGTKLGQ